MAMTHAHTYTGPERRATSHQASHAVARRFNAVDWISMVLLIVGGLNWGLVGLFDFNLVAALFGEGSALSRLVYVLVGLSALYSIYTTMKMGNRNRV